jgi:hypothetical protein
VVTRHQFVARAVGGRRSERLPDYVWEVHKYAVTTGDVKPVFDPPPILESHGVLDSLQAASDAFSSQKFRSGMTRAFVQVGLLPRTLTPTVYQMYPHEHPSSYG